MVPRRSKHDSSDTNSSSFLDQPRKCTRRPSTCMRRAYVCVRMLAARACVWVHECPYVIGAYVTHPGSIRSWGDTGWSSSFFISTRWYTIASNLAWSDKVTVIQAYQEFYARADKVIVIQAYQDFYAYTCRILVKLIVSWPFMKQVLIYLN